MKKLFLLLLLIPFIQGCSSDDNDSDKSTLYEKYFMGTWIPYESDRIVGESVLIIKSNGTGTINIIESLENDVYSFYESIEMRNIRIEAPTDGSKYYLLYYNYTGIKDGADFEYLNKLYIEEMDNQFITFFEPYNQTRRKYKKIEDVNIKD